MLVKWVHLGTIYLNYHFKNNYLIYNLNIFPNLVPKKVINCLK
jgi:hypothetical protein